MNEFTTTKISRNTSLLIKELSKSRGLKHTAAQIIDEAVKKLIQNDEQLWSAEKVDKYLSRNINNV